MICTGTANTLSVETGCIKRITIMHPVYSPKWNSVSCPWLLKSEVSVSHTAAALHWDSAFWWRALQQGRTGLQPLMIHSETALSTALGYKSLSIIAMAVPKRCKQKFQLASHQGGVWLDSLTEQMRTTKAGSVQERCGIPCVWIWKCLKYFSFQAH